MLRSWREFLAGGGRAREEEPIQCLLFARTDEVACYALPLLDGRGCDAVVRLRGGRHICWNLRYVDRTLNRVRGNHRSVRCSTPSIIDLVERWWLNGISVAEVRPFAGHYACLTSQDSAQGEWHVGLPLQHSTERRGLD